MPIFIQVARNISVENFKLFKIFQQLVPGMLNMPTLAKSCPVHILFSSLCSNKQFLNYSQVNARRWEGPGRRVRGPPHPNADDVLGNLKTMRRLGPAD